MSVGQKTPSDIEIGFDLGGGFHRGCDWDKSPCGETPAYYVNYRCSHPDHSEHGTGVILYCPRHYALTLLRIQEVDLQLNQKSFQEHVWEHGSIN